MTDRAVSSSPLAAVQDTPRRAAMLPLCRPWTEIAWAVLFVALSFALMQIWGRFFRTEMAGIQAVTSALPDRFHALVPAAIATQVYTIAVVFARGRILGGGDAGPALAIRPIQRPAVVVVLCIVKVALLLVALHGIHGVPQTTDGDLLASVAGGPLLLSAFLISVIVAAPISEELFFRGWLWTALRRSWGVWPTALVTGGAWWALHASFGVNFLHVLPNAVILSVIRHFCGSVRATIAFHGVHNAVVMACGLAALSLR